MPLLMPKNKLVLLIEDDDDHALLAQRAFSRHAPRDSRLVRLSDGEQARAYLSDARAGQYPDLVVLDLRLPRIGGLELLAEIKQSQELQSLPIVVWSTSDNRRDIAEAYRHSANAYLVKPGELAQFDEAIRDLAHFWLAWNRLAGPTAANC